MKYNVLKTASGNLTLLSRFVLVIITFVFFSLPFSVQIAQAGSFTSAKDTLITSRPSVSTAVTSTINIGDTTINVANTNGIMQNDTIYICTSAACTTNETKIVSAIISGTQIALTVGATGSYTTSGFVLYKAVSKHTLTIVTRSTVAMENSSLPYQATPQELTILYQEQLALTLTESPPQAPRTIPLPDFPQPPLPLHLLLATWYLPSPLPALWLPALP